MLGADCLMIDAWCSMEHPGITIKAQKHLKLDSTIEMTNKQAHLHDFVIFSYRSRTFCQCWASAARHPLKKHKAAKQIAEAKAAADAQAAAEAPCDK